MVDRDDGEGVWPIRKIVVSFPKELDAQLQWIREKYPNIVRYLVRMGPNTPLSSRNGGQFILIEDNNLFYSSPSLNKDKLNLKSLAFLLFFNEIREIILI